MHSYLRAIGFSKLNKESEIEHLLNEVYKTFDHRNAARIEKKAFLEMQKEFGSDMGIMLCGELDPDGFHRQYYFPYFKGSGITSMEEVTIESRISGNNFAGVLDDRRIGVSLIYYLQNPAEFQRERITSEFFGRNISVTLSGLSLSGKILLPVNKNTEQIELQRKSADQRINLISAARSGDPEAVYNLSFEEMDIYSMLSRRINREDIYTIVDTFFMPYGIECDQYQLMGTINSYKKVKNPATCECIYQMNIECNDLIFDICINEKDLIGSPDEGRRFKGNVWLQGHLNFQ